MKRLAGVSDPEQKRKIIGSEFIYTFDEEAGKIAQGENIKWLAQGTLYTDVIESGTHVRADDQVPPQRRRSAKRHGIQCLLNR